MPYQVTCPDCSAKLKSAQPVPAGRPLTCPQCKRVFTLSEPAPEIDTQPVATTPAPAAPAPVAPPPSVPAAGGYVTPRRGSRAEIDEIDTADIVDAADFVPPSKSKAKRRNDDDDDRPRSRSRRDDDEDDRPRRSRGPQNDFDFDEDERPKSKRRRDDEDDDRPRRGRGEDDDRSRRRRDREEEDDRPRRGRAVDEDDPPRSKRGRDEDDEDLPKGRSRRAVDNEDEDSDDDDRPRSRGRKGKKPNKALLFALIGGGAALLLLLGCILLNVFVDPLGLFGGGSSEMLAWMPSDTKAIEFVDVAQTNKYEEPKRNTKAQFGFVENAGIKMEDVSAIMAGGKAQGSTRETIVVKLNSAADRDKIVKGTSGEELTASGKKYYKTKDGMGLHFASDRLLVFTSTHTNMPKVLEKGAKVDLPDDLKTATGKANGHMWIAQVGPSGLGGGAGGPKGGMDPFGFGALPTAKYSVMNVNLSGGEADFRSEMVFNDSDSAKKMAEALEKMLGLVKGFAGFGAKDEKSKNAAKMLESAKVTTSGSSCIMTMRGPIEGSTSFGKFPF